MVTLKQARRFALLNVCGLTLMGAAHYVVWARHSANQPARAARAPASKSSAFTGGLTTQLWCDTTWSTARCVWTFDYHSSAAPTVDCAKSLDGSQNLMEEGGDPTRPFVTLRPEPWDDPSMRPALHVRWPARLNRKIYECSIFASGWPFLCVQSTLIHDWEPLAHSPDSVFIGEQMTTSYWDSNQLTRVFQVVWPHGWLPITVLWPGILANAGLSWGAVYLPPTLCIFGYRRLRLWRIRRAGAGKFPCEKCGYAVGFPGATKCPECGEAASRSSEATPVAAVEWRAIVLCATSLAASVYYGYAYAVVAAPDPYAMLWVLPLTMLSGLLCLLACILPTIDRKWGVAPWFCVAYNAFLVFVSILMIVMG